MIENEKITTSMNLKKGQRIPGQDNMLFSIIHTFIANLERWIIGLLLCMIVFGIILLVFLLKKGVDRENE